MASDKKIKSRKLIKDKYVSEKKSNKIMVESNDDVLNRKDKVRTRKIRMSLTSAEEKKLEEESVMDDNISILAMIVILVICFVLGIVLGYLLYKLAISGTI